MNAQTRQQLRDLNRLFYRQTADTFAETRNHPWPGWDRIPLPNLPQGRRFRILDVGCGNGRFAVALHGRLAGPFQYFGLDDSPLMISLAQPALAHLKDVEAQWIQADALAETPGDDWPNTSFDWVVAFGLIHHVPGLAQREQFVKQLAERVAPGGQLVIAAWQFADQERFEGRTLEWSSLHDAGHPAVEPSQVDPGDYLLGFGSPNQALRYCHHCDEDELNALSQSSELEEIARFSADGRSQNLNRYLVLKRPNLTEHASEKSPSA
ncbi:MAG: hypothetical protein CBC48_06300 [bacterium TMED88]|nr:hypothetical protein [Deltaproteobacteria bacterium]OUV34146.1 MAG: hypothetical protein CBC48_06300 [bacterium TMED88]